MARGRWPGRVSEGREAVQAGAGHVVLEAEVRAWAVS